MSLSFLLADSHSKSSFAQDLWGQMANWEILGSIALDQGQKSQPVALCNPLWFLWIRFCGIMTRPLCCLSALVLLITGAAEHKWGPTEARKPEIPTSVSHQYRDRPMPLTAACSYPSLSGMCPTAEDHMPPSWNTDDMGLSEGHKAERFRDEFNVKGGNWIHSL